MTQINIGDLVHLSDETPARFYLVLGFDPASPSSVMPEAAVLRLDTLATHHFGTAYLDLVQPA